MLFDSEKTKKKKFIFICFVVKFYFSKKIQLAMGTLFGQVWWPTGHKAQSLSKLKHEQSSKGSLSKKYSCLNPLFH